jgi:predicted glycogen debranching enzyme
VHGNLAVHMNDLRRPTKISAPRGFNPRQPEVAFGREVCNSLELAEQREWLVTNGLGGYASGTISGNLTRRYHGLLVAALLPPLGRTQLVAKLDETVRVGGNDFALTTNHWASGAVDPRGYSHIESFHLSGRVPVWRFSIGDALLEKRIWMRHGENTTYVQYTVLKSSSPVELRMKALVNYRDFHSVTHAGDWRMAIVPVNRGAKITAFDGATPFYILGAEASCELQHEWYRDYVLPRERERGLDDREDCLLAAIFLATLKTGQSVTIATSTQPDLDGSRELANCVEHERKISSMWSEHNPNAASVAPGWIRQLVLAADQFIVRRNLPDEADGRSVIAGYHWFGDWGRDTMIALPGLTLTTGRADVAKKILLEFSRYVDGGMLPNNFPDAGGSPSYNTVDAALWFFEAVRQYFAATQDTATMAELFPVLAEIISAHLQGTRFHIHADASDGLLYAGENGVQLTWMDAKIQDWVVTPRIGKPVEINALWYNALETMAALSRALKKPASSFQKMADTVKLSFARFWNPEPGFCYDVIDGPGIGNDASLRPNQIFAVSLPKSPLDAPQQKAVVDTCVQHLLTPRGLHSLAPEDPQYRGHYGGDQRERDGAYHQGTVWGWLLGPFVCAHLRVYGDPEMAAGFLEPLGKEIRSAGLGTLSEIFDGDDPFTARGCIAQAWTVAEVLRAWHTIQAAAGLRQAATI